MLALYMTLLEDERDKVRFRRLYDKYHKKMAQVARWYFPGDQAGEEDAVHESFLKIIEKFSKISEIFSLFHCGPLPRLEVCCPWRISSEGQLPRLQTHADSLLSCHCFFVGIMQMFFKGCQCFCKVFQKRIFRFINQNGFKPFFQFGDFSDRIPTGDDHISLSRE